MRRIGILTSGGDTPGMNAAIESAVMTAKLNGLTVIGVTKGYSGLLEGRLHEMHSAEVRGITSNGGTILKTARCPEMLTEKGRQKAVTVLKAFGVDGLIVIGGDGSFKGALELAKLGIPTIGLPGTIDNDLAYTDYTIGFDTAVNSVVHEMAKIRDTMNSHERIGIIEVMGNKCGDIALFAGVAGGAEYIVLPEVPFDKEDLCQRLQDRAIKGQHTSIIVISEGAGKGNDLASYVKERTALDVKAIVLGYTQRGGDPSAFDRIMATNMGSRAVELLLAGEQSRVVGIRDGKIVDFDIEDALSMKERFDFAMYGRHQAAHSY